MKHAQYDALVRGLEVSARERPGAYKLHVGGLALLGYGYVLSILLGSLAAICGIVWMAVHGRMGSGLGQIGAGLVVLVWMILRAIWVRFEPPDGIVLAPADAPALFAYVDRLRAALGAPRFHTALLTADFNASVVQLPRLGPLGWYRNYLTIGLPLMAALSPTELEAVLAHEVGHLSGAHGRFGAWIYRVRVTWMQLNARFEAQGNARLFAWFFRRWAPYFSAYSAVLAREHEREADRVAGELAGGQHLADALIKLEVVGTHLNERYWPAVFRRAADLAEPPPSAIGEGVAALRAGLDPADAERWLAAGLTRPTAIDESHPCLGDRVRALGATGTVAGLTPAVTAAEHFLGGRVTQLAATLDEQWRKEVVPAWQERHVEVAASRARLAEIEGETAIGPLWERAVRTLDLDGEDAALPVLRLVLEANADHAAANFTLGRILVGRDDDAGIAHLERAMTTDAHARAAGYEIILDYLERRDRHGEAEDYRQRAWNHGDLLEEAAEERRAVTDRDPLIEHGLGAADVARVTEFVAAFDEVRAAYLARKDVTRLAEMPLYVLGVRLRRPWWKYESAGWTQGILQRLADGIVLPGQCFVVSLESGWSRMARKLRRIPGAEIVAPRRAHRAVPAPQPGAVVIES